MSTLNVTYGAAIESAARRHRLDPVLLAAVAAQETGGPWARSGRNMVGDGGHGHGLFQIDDRWHAFARTPAAADPARNADYAAGMLAGLLHRYRGDARRALSAYNTGSPQATGTVTDWGDHHPVGYADSVGRHYALLASTTRTEGQMGFNLLGALGGAAQGLALGGPAGAIAGGLGGGLLGSSSPISTTGQLDNLGLSGWESGVLQQQDALNAQMAFFQLGVQRQANDFNMMTDEKSELQRESNALREVAMEQRKADISITREFIRSIA